MELEGFECVGFEMSDIFLNETDINYLNIASAAAGFYSNIRFYIKKDALSSNACDLKQTIREKLTGRTSIPNN